MIIPGEIKMHDMCVISLGGDAAQCDQLLKRFPFARVTRYYTDILSTIKRSITYARTSHMWVVLACSDCEQFDFEFEPVPWEQQQIHAWSAGAQRYGDIMLIPVSEFKKQNPEQLEWFRDINYHPSGPGRHAWPAFFVGSNDLTQSIKHIPFETEYAWVSTSTDIVTGDYVEPALWGEKHHELISFSKDNSVNLVPRHAKTQVVTQVYDYQNLHRRQLIAPQAQDIIFISYDEPQADENYRTLQQRFPQAKRVHGIEGMEKALRAAAALSSTPWFYAMFAKTRLHEQWDFSFVPDRWQAPKHYVFNAVNTSNGLCYGHMGIILYHRDSVLGASEWDAINGMDYTMSFDTESIPLISVYGEFASDSYRAWRTAFRETAKLAQWYQEDKCIETQYRLHIWSTHAQGPYAEWVLAGARDGINYYQQHAMDHAALKQMFRWDWLRCYFQERYEHDQ